MGKREFIEKILLDSGQMVKASFGESIPSKKKIEKTQIVTEVDIASERLLIEHIAKEYPKSGIIAEESGFIATKDGTYWVIDPIDGTSNFANAIPWFGVMVAFIEDHGVKDSGIYLPMTDEMYSASLESGAYKNSMKLSPPKAPVLEDSLISLCFSSENSEEISAEAKLFHKIAPHVLNIRSTNSAYDYAYAAEGKFAAMINRRNKLWDIAAILLIAKEAGMSVTDIDGKPLYLSLTGESYEKNYTLVISSPSISDQLLSIIKT